jgi:hypothetical protein
MVVDFFFELLVRPAEFLGPRLHHLLQLLRRPLPGAAVKLRHHAHEHAHAREKRQADGICERPHDKRPCREQNEVIHRQPRSHRGEKSRSNAAEQGGKHYSGVKRQVSRQTAARQTDQLGAENKGRRHRHQRENIAGEPVVSKIYSRRQTWF